MDKKAAVAGLLPALLLYACDRAVTPPKPGLAIAGSEPGSGRVQAPGSPKVEAMPAKPA